MPAEGGFSAVLAHALAAVQRDVSATLPDVLLRFVPAEPVDWESERALWVGFDDGRYWNSGSPVPEDVDADASLAAVAEGAQDVIMEVLSRAWPECPRHGGVLSVAAGPARWRCSDHDIAVGTISDV